MVGVHLGIPGQRDTCSFPSSIPSPSCRTKVGTVPSTTAVGRRGYWQLLLFDSGRPSPQTPSSVSCREWHPGGVGDIRASAILAPCGIVSPRLATDGSMERSQARKRYSSCSHLRTGCFLFGNQLVTPETMSCVSVSAEMSSTTVSCIVMATLPLMRLSVSVI